MTGIIWYKHKIKGTEQLIRLIENYARKGISVKSEVKIPNSRSIYFKNGDKWYLISATQSQRGRACNISLIDTEIDKKIIDTIIFPTIKSLPYRAYNYY